MWVASTKVGLSTNNVISSEVCTKNGPEVTESLSGETGTTSSSTDAESCRSVSIDADGMSTTRTRVSSSFQPTTLPQHEQYRTPTHSSKGRHGIDLTTTEECCNDINRSMRQRQTTFSFWPSVSTSVVESSVTRTSEGTQKSTTNDATHNMWVASTKVGLSTDNENSSGEITTPDDETSPCSRVLVTHVISSDVCTKNGPEVIERLSEVLRKEPKSVKEQLSDLKSLMSKKYKEPQTDKAQLSDLRASMLRKQQINTSLQKANRDLHSTAKLARKPTSSKSRTHKDSLMTERDFGCHVEMSSATVLEVLKQTKNTLDSLNASHAVKS